MLLALYYFLASWHYLYYYEGIDTSLLACFESTKELFIIVCVNINIIYYLCTFVRQSIHYLLCIVCVNIKIIYYLCTFVR